MDFCTFQGECVSGNQINSLLPSLDELRSQV